MLPYHLLWVEEPLLPEHSDHLRDLAAIPIPLAAGERRMDRWAYKTVLQQGVLQIIQPDVSLTGIHELEKIACMAEAYNVVVAPHGPNGTISLVTTLAVLGTIPNAVWQEHSRGLHYHQGYQSLPPGELEAYLTDPKCVDLREGYLPILDHPGLGIAINEEAVRAQHQEWFLADPTWYNSDGTLAEW